MRELLARHVGTKQSVRIKRRTPCEPWLNGYLLDLSDTLGLMHVFDDFEPDGYTVFRVADVEGVRSGPYERWWDEILRAEGLLGGLDLESQVDLSDMRSAVESVAQHYDHMIIECEDDEEDVEDFYIGSLLWTSHDNVVFRHFDGLGYWAPEPAEIDVDDITKVQFDAPYINTFSKYTRDGEPPEVPDDD